MKITLSSIGSVTGTIAGLTLSLNAHSAQNLSLHARLVRLQTIFRSNQFNSNIAKDLFPFLIIQGETTLTNEQEKIIKLIQTISNENLALIMKSAPTLDTISDTELSNFLHLAGKYRLNELPAFNQWMQAQLTNFFLSEHEKSNHYRFKIALNFLVTYPNVVSVKRAVNPKSSYTSPRETGKDLGTILLGALEQVVLSDFYPTEIIELAARVISEIEKPGSCLLALTNSYSSDQGSDGKGYESAGSSGDDGGKGYQPISHQRPTTITYPRTNSTTTPSDGKGYGGGSTSNGKGF